MPDAERRDRSRASGVSPTSTAWTPCACERGAAARTEQMPDSETTTRSGRASRRDQRARSRSTSTREVAQVAVVDADRSAAPSSQRTGELGSASCTSTSTSRPRSPACVVKRRRARVCSSAATISSTASAPAAQRLEQLVAVDDEVLAKDRQALHRAREPQVLERPAEVGLLGQDRRGAAPPRS